MKKGLGKGLGALITSYEDKIAADGAQSDVLEIDVTRVVPSPDQPRKVFKEPEIAELAESITEYGIIQPLIVTKAGTNYTIVAGERRWRAAQVAGLKKVPVIVREYSDLEILGIALIENIQREDLNPVEEAICYKRLNEEFGIKQDDIAKKIGKSRSHISNCIRILKLDNRVLDMLSDGKLTMGHAKAILTIDDNDEQFYVASEVIAEGMNVRKSEDFVRKHIVSTAQLEKQLSSKTPISAQNKESYAKYKNSLQSFLGAPINIKTGKMGGGKIEINYKSQEELERIIGVIQK